MQTTELEVKLPQQLLEAVEKRWKEYCQGIPNQVHVLKTGYNPVKSIIKVPLPQLNLN